LLTQGATAHGWHNELWTAKRVRDVIRKHFGIGISDTRVRKLLRNRLGWTSQRPSQIESKRDEAKILRWREHIFPKIVANTYSRNAYLIFIDEAGFMASPVRRQTYAPRGKPPVVKVTEPHRRISTAGAITISPEKQSLYFLYHVLPNNQNFRGATIVVFLKEIISRIRRPMTILWDGFSIHLSEPVNKFLEEHPEILIEPLPEYAHELNPVDKVWLYLKYDCLANYAPATLDELHDRLIQELDALPLKSNVLAWCIEQTGLKTQLS
jgi:transposase